eukprot:gb/GEZN01006021.1/.p1 GENE.gb/GEZN01006021.1/~~gb/GEZN01006021.1/.p1  ORF type:complete len:426 (+),score=35.83 gb/GEZN01006021.1/:72-1349(+)
MLTKSGSLLEQAARWPPSRRRRLFAVLLLFVSLWLVMFRLSQPFWRQLRYWTHASYGYRELHELQIALFPHDDNVVNEQAINPLPRNASFAVVTCASQGYEVRLLNLIGSLHVHEPNVNIIVYDLGLDASWLRTLSCLESVSIRQFSFSALPEHVRWMGTYAFKPLVVADAVKRDGGSILFLDAGSEVWGSLREVQELMQFQGHFFTIQADSSSLIHPQTLASVVQRLNWTERLDLNLNNLLSRPQISAGFMGWVAGGDAARSLLEPWTSCALDPRCIAPANTTLRNHKFEQSVLSVLVWGNENGLRVHESLRYWRDWATIKVKDELGTLFFSRRYHCNRPYIARLRRMAQCPAALSPMLIKGITGGRATGCFPLYGTLVALSFVLFLFLGVVVAEEKCFLSGVCYRSLCCYRSRWRRDGRRLKT